MAPAARFAQRGKEQSSRARALARCYLGAQQSNFGGGLLPFAHRTLRIPHRWSTAPPQLTLTGGALFFFFFLSLLAASSVVVSSDSARWPQEIKRACFLDE